MLVMELFKWWYGPGYLRLFREIKGGLTRLALTFSAPILIRTLFAPWRRIISPGSSSFIEDLKAMLDNIISRFVGFGVRLVVLITAGILLALGAVLGAVVIVVWPLTPVLGLFLIFKGLIG